MRTQAVEKVNAVKFVWGALLAASGGIWISASASVVPTQSGSSFFYPFMYGMIVGLLSCLVIPFVALTAVKGRRLGELVKTICLSAAVFIASYFIASEIEFRRTPPCWGMHSQDPGSGESCPEGMEKDFSVSDLQRWHKENNR